MMNKKGLLAIQAIMIILGFILAFGLILNFVIEQGNDAGVIVDQNVSQAYLRLQADQASLVAMQENLTNGINSVQEASIGDYAYFGLKGVLVLMKAPLSLVSITNDAMNIMLPFLPIPGYMKTILVTMAMFAILFIIIKFMTSRGQEP